MSLSQSLLEYISACFTGLWVQSHEHEHDDALREIAGLCRQENWQLARWDVDAGLQLFGQSQQPAETGSNDPLAAIALSIRLTLTAAFTDRRISLMSEYMGAEIRIGGPVPERLVPGLCATIAAQGVATDWGEAAFQPKTQEELLEACQDYDEGPLLCLFDDQARWGQFEDLERFLQEHEIPFSRYSEPKYEYTAQVTHFRPGLDLVTWQTDPQHEPTVRVCDLSDVAKEIELAGRLLVAGKVDKAASTVRRAQRLLKKQLPAEVPPLNPFTIEPE